MNKKPVSYKQGDQRWGSKPYRVPGETSTIASAGCGPTCAAMVIATLKDKRVTPETTCAWSVAHGYKALKQGTYYSYFKPQMAAYGIQCEQLLGSRILTQPNHPIHEKVREYLRQGDWVIALMGPGTWTKGGHFVLVWDWDGRVRILDPASSADKRLNGDPATFRREVRCYWRVDARDYNNEEDDMNIDKMTDAEVLKLGQRIQAVMGKQSVSSALAPELAEAKAKGITDGTSPGAFCTRAQAAVMTLRAIKKKKRPGIIPRPLFLAKSVEYWYNTFAAPPHTGNRKGVSVMVYFLISFLVSVAASVVAYYICKWLDRHRKGQ